MTRQFPLASIPSARPERWQLMREVIADWYAPLTSADGYADPVGPCELPAALIEWYQLCGRRSDIWSRQDHWYAPEELPIRDGHLIIMVERQGCAYWGIPLARIHEEDPPVYVDMTTPSEWVRENSTVSEFALQQVAFNIKFSDAPCWANGAGDVAALDLVCLNYPQFPLRDWHWPIYPTRFYGDRDIIIETNGEEDDIWFWISARNQSAFDNLNEILKPTGIRWEAEKTAR